MSKQESRAPKPFLTLSVFVKQNPRTHKYEGYTTGYQYYASEHALRPIVIRVCAYNNHSEATAEAEEFRTAHSIYLRAVTASDPEWHIVELPAGEEAPMVYPNAAVMQADPVVTDRALLDLVSATTMALQRVASLAEAAGSQHAFTLTTLAEACARVQGDIADAVEAAQPNQVIRERYGA